VASYYDWIQRGMARFNNQTLLDEIEAQKAQQQAQQQEQQQEDGDLLPIVNPSMPDCMPCPYVPQLLSPPRVNRGLLSAIGSFVPAAWVGTASRWPRLMRPFSFRCRRRRR
jgi:hypothetical protein